MQSTYQNLGERISRNNMRHKLATESEKKKKKRDIILSLKIIIIINSNKSSCRERKKEDFISPVKSWQDMNEIPPRLNLT